MRSIEAKVEPRVAPGKGGGGPPPLARGALPCLGESPSARTPKPGQSDHSPGKAETFGPAPTHLCPGIDFCQG